MTTTMATDSSLEGVPAAAVDVLLLFTYIAAIRRGVIGHLRSKDQVDGRIDIQTSTVYT